MIWYLLYPLRGTTEAPALSPTHPLRKAFTRYGRYAARHVVTTLLVSAAVATILLYPIPFLFTTDFINGASNLPHHAWTVAQPLPYHVVAEPDIIMRSVWVHGSYMQALDPKLLVSALALQDELLGSTEDIDPRDDAEDTKGHPYNSSYGEPTLTERDAAHAMNGFTNQSWFFHSPLQYWGCSKARILADDDVISTVNYMKTMSTAVNVTLRHSVVFSGKRFEYRRLVAADALVITLLHRRDSPIGRQWEKKAALLATQVTDEWDVYPPDGIISSSRLYEFQFRPISTQDTLTLTLAYGLAIGYFVVSLFKVRAVKSKVGLMITVVTQIVFAIMSSFTVCAVFNIDLSRIPRAAYPLVILAMSLENIFRLINAVILTPSEDSTTSRIGHAFGETAPVALASTAQNVLILTVLASVVSPGVSAFCIFLAVAIVFDVFYLATFFLAVLSVDVRRTELSDALAKVAMRQTRRAVEPRRRTWIEQVVHGQTALSTRIAGTFVMIGFVVIAQWHFFQGQTMLNTTIGLFWDSAVHLFGSSKTSELEAINQARSPTSWLRLQDHETAQELINIIKPSAHSYTAQVHDPLVFVKKGADRSSRGDEPTLLPAYYDFINHHLTQFVVIVVVVIAALRLLISYLLYEDKAHIEEEGNWEDTPLISIQHLPKGHDLDVVMLTASLDGHIVSVGLDRMIRVWNARCDRDNYALPEHPSDVGNVFPVLALAVDDASRWLAIVSPQRALFWSLTDKSWVPSVKIASLPQRPACIFFAQSNNDRSPALVVVRRDGAVTELTTDERHQTSDFVLCEDGLAYAEPLVFRGHGTIKRKARFTLLAISKKGSVCLASRTDSEWTSRQVPAAWFGSQKPHQISGVASLGLFAVATAARVHLFDVEHCELLYTVETEMMKPRSLHFACTTQRTAHIDSPGITSLTMAYIEAETGDCILHTFLPSEDFDSIGLHAPSGATDGEGCAWGDALLTRRRVKNPGSHSVLSDGSVVGIRRRNPREPENGGQCRGSQEGLRNRFTSRSQPRPEHIEWEAWTVSLSARAGADEERPLFSANEVPIHLLVSSLGPQVKMGMMSIVFSLGNMVKLVTVGGIERYGTNADDAAQENLLNMASRRRKGGGTWRPRGWT
ncbi:sterol-sensing domain of SREBP cleavage-activation-domain-containing protein [Emericellopsis atlantica]|uniref:Sterol regulatory element-binding protein cleavage-activating protein n=1 Tax=Emericellopsis atlantica TaxID=2614577 RepID=A0A9P8CTE2_9HYPO|nr:sterol-sensing domain of SREBP cleavage-activation-domain-containing protein [Emericellopsis atlantica]KAG9258312.1 sterol-sensing domain of SREBP cleavage-activation-domain-containing protein [Emericellopsis atlantica]